MELGLPTLDWMQTHVTLGMWVCWTIASIVISRTDWYRKERCAAVKKCVRCQTADCKM